MKVENPFEPILGLLKWKDSLTEELVSGSFLLYSGHFSRVLFFAGTIYGIVFHLMKPVYCQTSSQVPGRFIDQACIFPHYAAHQLHGPFTVKPERQQYRTFEYYIWIYGLVFLMVSCCPFISNISFGFGLQFVSYFIVVSLGITIGHLQKPSIANFWWTSWSWRDCLSMYSSK